MNMDASPDKRRLTATRLPWWLAISFLLAAPPASAEVYKWVDEKGVTHYSETPPPGRKSGALPIKPAPPAEAVPSAKTWREQEGDLLERQLRQQQREEKEKKVREEQEANIDRCQAARQRLEMYQTKGRIFRRDSQGEPVFVEPEERPAIIADITQQIEAYCKP